MLEVIPDLVGMLAPIGVGYYWGNCCCKRLDVACMGGLASNPNNLIAQVDGYRNSTDAWITRAALPSARRLHAGASLIGFGYSLAGQSNTSQISDNDQYAIASDTWTSREAVPSPAKNQLGAVGIAGESPKIYAFAGQHFSGVPNDHVENEEYDPTGDSWASRADKPEPPLRACAYAGVGGRAYAWGGFAGDGTTFGGTFRNDNDEYNPAGDSWSARTDLPGAARDAMMGGGSVDGKGYAMGGRSAAPNAGVDRLDEYNPGSDSWTARGPSAVPRCFLAVASSAMRVHGFGGNHLTTSQSSNHQCYEPSTESWLEVASLPPFERTQAAAFGS